MDHQINGCIIPIDTKLNCIGASKNTVRLLHIQFSLITGIWLYICMHMFYNVKVQVWYVISFCIRICCMKSHDYILVAHHRHAPHKQTPLECTFNYLYHAQCTTYLS